MPRGYLMVGFLFHLSKPIYQAGLLLQHLKRSVKVLARNFPDSLISLTGELNKLRDSQNC